MPFAKANLEGPYILRAEIQEETRFSTKMFEKRVSSIVVQVIRTENFLALLVVFLEFPTGISLI